MSSLVQSKRYGEADLREFREVINQKIAKVENQLEYLESQISETTESKDSQGDWMDDSSSGNDLDMLQTMAARQRVHLLDLQNALQRVHNKSYGICIVTGELIDKKRLLAVPTTSKCLAAKMAVQEPEKKKATTAERPATGSKKIISRVIKRTDANGEEVKKPAKPVDWNEEEDDDLDLDLENDDDMDDDDNSTELDLDSLSEEDLDD